MVEVELDSEGLVVDGQAEHFRKPRVAHVHYARPRTSRDEEERGVCSTARGPFTSNIADVTCKRCKALLRKPAASSEINAAIAQGLIEAFSVPTLGVPPTLTPESWGASCKGATAGRCRHCEACERDAEIERFAFAAPWAKQHRARKATMWPSLDAAVNAWVAWRYDGPSSPSASGPMLDKARDGLIGGGQPTSRPDDRNLQRAGDLVIIEKLFALAYPTGAHQRLTAGQCKFALVERCTLGHAKTQGDRALEFGVTVGDLKSAVRAGRRFMTIELAARDLIPEPPLRGALTHDYVALIEAISQRREELKAVQDELAARPRKWVREADGEVFDGH